MDFKLFLCAHTFISNIKTQRKCRYWASNRSDIRWQRPGKLGRHRWSWSGGSLPSDIDAFDRRERGRRPCSTARPPSAASYHRDSTFRHEEINAQVSNKDPQPLYARAVLFSSRIPKAPLLLVKSPSVVNQPPFVTSAINDWTIEYNVAYSSQ